MDGMRSLPDGCANLCVTSPPYWLQRAYGIARWEGGDADCSHSPGGVSRVGASGLQGGKETSGHQQEGYGVICRKCGAVRVNDGEHGSESSLAEYIEQQIEVFREVRRVLRDDGVLFLNLGDKAVGSGGAGGDYNDGGLKDGQPKFGRASVEGLAAKNIYGLPWRIAFALQADGWILRRDIIWVKSLSFAGPVVGSTMPESAEDRPTAAHEYIFQFVKQQHYWYDGEAEREVAVYPNNGRGKRTDSRRGTEANAMHGDNGPTRNLRDVWYIQPEPMSWMICTACMAVYDGRQYGRLAMTGPPPKKGYPTGWDTTSEGERGELHKEGRSHPKRVCKCGRSDSWTSHFAAFPSKLVRVCVNLGCPEKVCAVCGAPWVREVERGKKITIDGRSTWNIDHNTDSPLVKSAEVWRRKSPMLRSMAYEARTLGFTPTCSCDGDTRPGLVLDPYLGSGTTVLTAEKMGRRSAGMELSPVYCALIEERLRRQRQQVRLDL